MDSGIFREVIVSTDDAEIADVARRYGASVSLRPAHLSGDAAPVATACEHVLQEVMAKGEGCDLLCLLYATAVLVSAEDLRQAYALMAQGELERLVSVCELPVHPFKALRLEAGRVTPQFPEQFRAQTQSMPHLVVHNGAFAWARCSAFLKEPRFVGPNTGAFSMPWWRSVDIDTPSDWERAEQLAQMLRGSD